MPRTRAPRAQAVAPKADEGAAVSKLELKRIHETIQGAGLHRTAPRVAVLRLFMESPAPLSHAEVSTQLRPAGVSAATVYTNLKALSSVGLLRRLDLGDHIWRYELIRPGSGDRPARDRLHFICSECGRVSFLPGTSASIDVAPRAPKAVADGRFEVLLRGRCDDCARGFGRR